MGEKVTGCVPDDPLRCKAVSGTRQCGFRAAEGFDYCNFHNSGQRIAQKKDANRQYLLKRWRAEVDHYANHPQIKSLREEIGITRLLMQSTLNKCEDANDLLIHGPRLMELTSLLASIIQTCHKMEEKTQFLVDKNQIVHLAEQIILIVSQFITDPNVLTKIADHIKMAIESKAVVTVNVDGSIDESRVLPDVSA